MNILITIFLYNTGTMYVLYQSLSLDWLSSMSQQLCIVILKLLKVRLKGDKKGDMSWYSGNFCGMGSSLSLPSKLTHQISTESHFSNCDVKGLIETHL